MKVFSSLFNPYCIHVYFYCFNFIVLFFHLSSLWHEFILSVCFVTVFHVFCLPVGYFYSLWFFQFDTLLLILFNVADLSFSFYCAFLTFTVTFWLLLYIFKWDGCSGFFLKIPRNWWISLQIGLNCDCRGYGGYKHELDA